MNRVGIYLRVSTEEQAKIVEGSLVSQRQRLEEYIAGQNRREAGWGTLIDVYCDEAKSGKDMNRPEFQRLLEDVKSGRINLILATELSRLSRSIRDFCELWDLFKARNTRFITLREQFDTTTAAGEMMVFNLINFAQFERKQTAERISANFLSRAKRGLWNGGRVPMGYARAKGDTGTLTPDRKEAKTINTIFRTFLETGALRQTCFKLTKAGIRTHDGNHFTLSGLHCLLTNRAYIGQREIGKKSGKTEIVTASWPAIINAETFEQAQKLLEGNKSKYKPDEWKTYPYPLTEKFVCGECGKLMGGKSAYGRNRKHHYYEHPRKLAKDGVTHTKRCRLERVRAEKMETMVLGFLKELLEKPEKSEEMVRAYSKRMTSEIPALEGRLKTIASELRQTEKKVENLIARLSELPKEISAEPIYRQLKALNEKLDFLKETRTTLEAEKNKATTKAIDQEGLKQRIQGAVSSLQTAPKDKQRPIFANVIHFAELHPTKVRLGLYSPLRAGSTSVYNGARGGT